MSFQTGFEMLRLSHISTLQKSIYQTSLSWKQQTMSAVTFYFWILLQILKKWRQDISICSWIIKRTFMAFIWGSRSKIQRNDKTGRISVARFHEKNVSHMQSQIKWNFSYLQIFWAFQTAIHSGKIPRKIVQKKKYKLKREFENFSKFFGKRHFGGEIFLFNFSTN